MADTRWKERIEGIADGEWWRSSGQKAFEEIFLFLTGKGLSEDEAIDVLEKAYAAVANEFGG